MDGKASSERGLKESSGNKEDYRKSNCIFAESKERLLFYMQLFLQNFTGVYRTS